MKKTNYIPALYFPYRNIVHQDFNALKFDCGSIEFDAALYFCVLDAGRPRTGVTSPLFNLHVTARWTLGEAPYFHVCFKAPYDGKKYGIEEVEAMARVLRKVRSYMRQQARKQRIAHTFGHYVQMVCEALHVRNVVICTHEGTLSNWDAGEYQYLDVDDSDLGAYIDHRFRQQAEDAESRACKPERA